MSKANFENQVDQNLIAFIKQHKPIAPPSTVNLEQQIMAQIDQLPVAEDSAVVVSQPGQSKLRQLVKGLWLLPAIAVGAGIFWASNRQPQFAISEAESLEIEAALLSSWSGAIDYDLDAVGDPYAEPVTPELFKDSFDGEESDRDTSLTESVGE
ncbi:hypothetical protein Pse7367_2618 [Thalassoporum mexicanum PCC 7367]|uniref:hypothetical protein n=1 Tax=Thalassoporum mexicanum TaxID=3457544 RepID=UPI00029F8B62|nr:hypothetical protein [Pseudanabaena sp. PCC 7367]AFY70874.1 hypothetical protein Pse7367_2618 [Pseudanabaena sp. PCC 7367]